MLQLTFRSFRRMNDNFSRRAVLRGCVEAYAHPLGRICSQSITSSFGAQTPVGPTDERALAGHHLEIDAIAPAQHQAVSYPLGSFLVAPPIEMLAQRLQPLPAGLCQVGQAQHVDGA